MEHARRVGYWDPDGDLKEEAAEDSSYLENLRGETLGWLADLRQAVANYRRDMTEFESRACASMRPAGFSAGEVPTELYDRFSSLHALGILDAAGFIAVNVDGPDEDAGTE
jgi:hypothetical protein